MDKGTLWLDRLSSWMEEKDDASFCDPLVAELREEWRIAAEKSDSLLEYSDHLQKAFSQIAGRWTESLLR